MRLSKEIFSELNLQRAIRAYKGYADIEITEVPDAWMLDFKNCRYGAERTEREFENYLIGLEN